MEVLPTDNVEEERREGFRGGRGRDKIIYPKGGETEFASIVISVVCFNSD